MSCRRDYRELTTAQRARFVAALYHVKARGVIDAFADAHANNFGNAHGSSGFLPWHREFLRRFEAELRTYDPRVDLPYWNSPSDKATDGPLWANDFLGQFDAAWGLGRSLGGSTIVDPPAVDGVLGSGSFTSFSQTLEGGIHGRPHNWVGGLMGGARSPADPVFYLHHAFVDMLFAQWQLRNPTLAYEQYNGGPAFTDPVQPWPATVQDVWDHRTVGLYGFPPGWTQDAPRVTPPPAAPPTVDFVMVPEGLTFLRAAAFEVEACNPLTFNVATPVVDPGAAAGTSFQRVSAASFSHDPTVDPTARIWLAYTGTNAGDSATGRVDVSCVETGDAWQVPILATTIAKPKAAIALVLDQSNSMTFPSGIAPGAERADVLRFSAPPAVGVLDDDHAMLITTFDHDAHPQIGLTPADAVGRLQLQGKIGDYEPNPNGWTAIGEALKSAHDQLAPVTGYDVKATVLLTDGRENHGPYDRLAIEDVEDTIGERTFAIGLGVPGEIDPQRLTKLCDDTDGFMLITGALDGDALFRLATYYQQIVAGVTNHDIVLDPEGWVQPGVVTRIPFWIAETDILARAVLLTPDPWGLQMGLETPAGDVMAPAFVSPMVERRVGTGLQMYRVGLPLPIGGGDAHAGRWHVLLGYGRPGGEILTHAIAAFASAQPIRYSVMVQTYSNLTMAASLTQTSYEPGATIQLSVRLREYDQPLLAPANVRADMTRPDDSLAIVSFALVGDGRYEATVVATDAGVYRFRYRADGTTSRGQPFTRERLRTAAVWRGGDEPPRPPRQPADPWDRWCELVECLVEQRGIARLLERLEIDRREFLKCVEELCGDRRDPGERLTALVRDPSLASEIRQAIRSVKVPR